MEVTVHGGFEVVHSVLHGLSLLFGAKDFHVAVTIFLLLFFTVTALFAAMSYLWGETKSPFSWTKPFLYSYILYWAFIIPLGTIHLYDDVKNQYAKIDGIPLLIVSLAGFTNQIENGLGKMLETALSPPLPVSDLAWGEAFDFLTGAYSYQTSGFFSAVEDHRSRSLWMYINRCVDVEVSIGHISVNALWHNNGWCSDVLAKADNPALYTIVYDPAWGSDTINCKDAWWGGRTDHGHSWPGLNELICNDYAMWADVAAYYCTSRGWGDNTSVVNRCKQILANSAKFCLYPGTPSSEFLFTNSFIARKMVDFVSQYSTSMDQARLAGILATQSRMTSIGVMAAEYIPLMREATFAIVLLLAPILVLLMNTPFVGEAFKTLVGLFLFVAFWGIADRGITALHLNLAYDMCQTLRNQGFGMGVLFDLPQVDTKMVTILGYMRLTGATLAGVITWGALKVGGYFLAGVASFLARGAGSGASAGASYTTPEGRIAHYEQTMKAAAAFGAAANWRYPAGMFWDDVRKEMERAEMARAAKGELLGAGGASGATSLMANAAPLAQMSGLLKSVGDAGLGKWLTAATGKYQAGWTEGLAKGAELQSQLEGVKKEFGLGSDLEAARYALAHPEVSKRFGQDLGLLKEYAAMKKAGVIGADTSLRDYMAQREAIRGMMGGADVFGFARKAGEMGLSPAQAAYARALWNWGKEMGHLNELMQRFKGKDLSELSPQEIGELGNTLGRVYGAFEHARTTAGGLGMNEATFTEYQKGLNEATKFFANAAAATWLETGEIPGWMAEPLQKIASTPEGKRMLQKHLSNLEISSLTPKQAERLNQVLAAKGLATRFRPGDAARLYLGYTGDPKNPFTVSLAKADTGAERKATDTTQFDRGITAKNWNGFFMLGNDGYTIQGAKSFEYDPLTGRFAVSGALVRDAAGNTYQADLIGKGKAIKDSAGNIVGVEVKNLSDLAVEKFESVHGSQIPEFNLTPERALNLAHNPEKLAATLEKFKDNPLVRQAFVTEFSSKLAQGLKQAYGDVATRESISHTDQKVLTATAGLTASGKTSPPVVTVGKIMPAPLAKFLKSFGFGGNVGISRTERIVSEKGESADASWNLAAVAVRQALNDGYSLADRYHNDAPLENAAFKVFNAVSSIEESAEKSIETRERMEKEAGKTDLTSTTPTEYMTGDKIKLERLGKTIDVRGIDGKKQIPWKAVSIDKQDENKD